MHLFVCHMIHISYDKIKVDIMRFRLYWYVLPLIFMFLLFLKTERVLEKLTFKVKLKLGYLLFQITL